MLISEIILESSISFLSSAMTSGSFFSLESYDGTAGITFGNGTTVSSTLTVTLESSMTNIFLVCGLDEGAVNLLLEAFDFILLGVSPCLAGSPSTVVSTFLDLGLLI